jgi:hypothetical protein
MNIIEWHQWALDTERMYLSSLSNEDPNRAGFFDEFLFNAALQRCQKAFGPDQGPRYFETLMLTLPDRRPELFPELRDF